MSEPLRVAVVGVGRMGAIHAFHLHELQSEGKGCRLSALVDIDTDRARRVASGFGSGIPVFGSIDELCAEKACDAAVIVTPTRSHMEHATALIRRGLRVLLEKPLTGALESDREFAAMLDRDYPDALMIAFQRRFDEPLRYARQILHSGAIGRLFKIFSALEDSNPPPDGYNSGGILPDMSVHNVDEILWLTGRMPRAALAVGSRLYSHRLTTCDEDFDDAMLLAWFEDELLAQVQVSRNHVSGYRVETILFGDSGQIRVGRFEQQPLSVRVEAYGRHGASEPLADRTFQMRDYRQPLAEFIDRFGPAYKSELLSFIECCRDGRPFPTSHRDGLRAQEVISAAMLRVLTEGTAQPVRAVSAARMDAAT